MFKRDNIDAYNLDDCGKLLYNDNQEVFQGGSGVACSALVSMGYIYHQLLERQLKRVLIVSTGALLSPMMTYQKETIPTIAHAISLEVDS
jgi:stage V sporulation protein AD